MGVYVGLDSPDSIGLILVHHKDLAERLRSGLRAKQQGEFCRRAGEKTLLTSGCHETTGKEVGGGIFVMMDATRMVDNYHMCWTGILAPALTIGLVVPSRKSSEVVHQHQETDHVRALFLQRRWEGSVRDRFRTLKAMRRSWQCRTWRRWSTFRRLGGAPFCVFLE